MVRSRADDDHDRKLLADVASHGWHLVAIEDDPSGVAYVFSVGIFHTLGQPELCIFGLNSTSLLGRLINGIGSLMKAGRRFANWCETDEVLEGYACMFREVNPSWYREYFGYALWFDEGPDFPMLQCVWPDKNHWYPWDSGFDAELFEGQPVLAMKDAWPFRAPKNQATFTTRPVLEEGYPVLLVAHDDDGSWQFLCGTTNDVADGRLVCLGDMVEAHPSVRELADLPIGWQAARAAPGEPWRRSRSDDDLPL